MTEHHPVLLPTVLELLAPRSPGVYVDATLGGGGHAEAILHASRPDGRLVGLDRDPTAVERVRRRLAPYGDRVRLHHARASHLARVIRDSGGPEVDGVLLDLGLSSVQLDDPDRGFSFSLDGPLDMRMDATSGFPAATVVNEWEPRRLARVLRELGEEPRAGRVARAIVQARPIESTGELASVVAGAVGRPRDRRHHPATRTFQALRILVNEELEEVEGAVDAAMDAVRPGGRVVVIAFHSLEDRRVKRAFRHSCGIGTARDPWGNPVPPPGFELLTRRPVKGRDADSHPRARSARLRAVRRLGSGEEQPRVPGRTPAPSPG